LLSDPSRLQAAIDYFLPLFEDGSLRPVADDKRYGLDEIADAFTHLESNTQFGKVIVTI
jgi:NADPH:quinone reductase-like Zn-dependent oxidoreductase